MVDAVVGAIAVVLAALLSGRFVTDRPGRRRKEISELLEMQARTPDAAQAALTALISRKWVALLVPRPWTTRVQVVLVTFTLATAATSFSGLAFARSARLHRTQAAAHLDASDRLASASLHDSVTAISGLIKQLHSIEGGKQTAATTQLLRFLEDSTKEQTESTSELVKARASQRAAASSDAIASDLVHATIGLLIASVLLMLVLVVVARHELGKLEPARRSLAAALRP